MHLVQDPFVPQLAALDARAALTFFTLYLVKHQLLPHQ